MSNKYTIPSARSRHIPEVVSDEVQRRHFFECAWCGTGLTERHHIEEFALGGRHTPDNLILLCPNCHTQVHTGAISTNELIGRKSTHKKGDRIESTYAFELDEPIIRLGGARFINAPNMLTSNTETLLSWKRNRNNDIMLSARLYAKNGDLVFWMANNRYWAPSTFKVERKGDSLSIASEVWPPFFMKFYMVNGELQIEGLSFADGNVFFLHPNLIFTTIGNGCSLTLADMTFNGEHAGIDLKTMCYLP